MKTLMFVYFFNLLRIIVFLKAVDSTHLNNRPQLGDISWGVRMKETYLQFPFSVLIDCIRQCLRRKRCQSFNYSHQLVFCELSYVDYRSGTSYPQLKSDIFIHSDISRWNQLLCNEDLTPNCTNHDCKDDETCIGGGLCQISDCGPAPVPPADAVILNSGHHEVGYGFFYGCKDGFVLINNEHNGKIERNKLRVVCQETGQWQNSPIACDGMSMFEGRWYYFSSIEMSWMDAKDFCRKRNLHLVKIDSRMEYQFLLKNINYWTWTGMNDIANENNWVWEADNSPITWSDWSTNEPNNANEEDCMTMPSYEHGWNDALCTMKLKFICE